MKPGNINEKAVRSSLQNFVENSMKNNYSGVHF